MIIITVTIFSVSVTKDFATLYVFMVMQIKLVVVVVPYLSIVRETI